jgi:hypothetical protein
MSVPRPRLWFPLGLVALAVPPLLLLSRAWLGPRQGLRFSDIRELKAWAEGRGLHCRSDWQDGRVTGGLALSTRPLTWEQVGRLCRAAPGQGPDWEGVIWAIDRSSALGALAGPPWNGECRVWGGVLVSGDSALLDRIERGQW